MGRDPTRNKDGKAVILKFAMMAQFIYSQWQTGLKGPIQIKTCCLALSADSQINMIPQSWIAAPAEAKQMIHTAAGLDKGQFGQSLHQFEAITTSDPAQPADLRLP